jgi:hypothetical protein
MAGWAAVVFAGLQSAAASEDFMAGWSAVVFAAA